MAAAARRDKAKDESSSSSSSSQSDEYSTSSSSSKDEEGDDHSTSSEPSSDEDEKDGHFTGENDNVSSSSTNSDEDSDVEEAQEGENFDQDEADDVSASSVAESRPVTARRSAVATPMLSKSWKVLSTHVPMYTGGKFVVVPPHHHPATQSPLSSSAHLAPQSTRTPPLVLLPVGGNVALVNLRAGTVVGKLRAEAGGGHGADDGEDDDDDERGHDPDSITAFDGTSSIVVTCSHNSILRLYAIQYGGGERIESGDDDGKHGEAKPETEDDQSMSVVATGIKLTKTIGRSGHALPVTVLKFHPSGVFFATGSLDGTVRVWDVRGMYCTHSFRWGSASEGAGVRSGVTCISWKDSTSNTGASSRTRQPKSIQIAIGREDGSIVVHDLMDQSSESKPSAVMHDHVGAVTCISWLPVGPGPIDRTQHVQKRRERSPPYALLSAGRDAVLNLWVNGTSVHTLPVYEQVEGMELVASVEDQTGESHEAGVWIVFATAGSKGVVRTWKINESRRIEPVAVQVAGTSSAEGGGYVAMQKYREVTSMGGIEEHRSSVRLITANGEHNLSVLDSVNLETTCSLVGHLDDILDLRILPSYDAENAEVGPTATVALATNSAEIRLMKVATASNERASESSTSETLSGHSAAVLCLDVSPCHRFLLSCGKDRSVRVWDTTQRLCVGLAVGHTEAVGAAAFSRRVAHYRVPSSDQLAFCASVSVDRTLKRWNLPRTVLSAKESHEPVFLAVASTVRAHEKDINMVSVAPNDSLIATASQDKTVRLWNASDLSLKATLKGHRRGVWDVQFSPVDRVVVTGSGDKTLKLWSLTDYSCVRTFQGHLSTVLRARFLSCGLQLVSSGADGLIKLWTIRTNECEATLDGHVHKVWALDLIESDGGRPMMVSGGGDSRLVVWHDTTVEEAQAKQHAFQENLLLDQQLANHLRRKEYGEALAIALRQDKPMHVLRVLTSIIESDLERHPGSNGVPAVQALVRDWSEAHLTQVLRYCREWNTRARNCMIAMIVVRAVVSMVPLPKLAEMDGVPEILAGILVYAERHQERLERLRTGSYLLDFVLSNMGSLEPESDNDFAAWERTTMSSHLVLPPEHVDGRIQVGGATVVGRTSGPATSRRSGSGPMGVSSDDSVETIDAGDLDDDSSSDGESEMS